MLRDATQPCMTFLEAFFGVCFGTNFYSILTPFWTSKWLQNPSKIDKKSINFLIDFCIDFFISF